MRKFRIPYIPYRSLLLSTTVLNESTTVLNDEFRVVNFLIVKISAKARSAAFMKICTS